MDSFARLSHVLIHSGSFDAYNTGYSAISLAFKRTECFRLPHMFDADINQAFDFTTAT